MTAIPTARLLENETLLIDVPAIHSERSTAVTTTTDGNTGGEWPVAIKMVERAAGRIKDYEQKLRSLEEDTRAYMVRVTAEQEQALAQKLKMESRLEHLESVLTHTTEELHETRLEANQASRRLKETEARLAEEIRQGSAYARQVEALLGGV
jgi:chromosome segregation ATPase